MRRKGQLVKQLSFYVFRQAGKGYGKTLLEFAVNERGFRKVDVNEQNEQAFRFYRNRGFEVINRDETDAQGKPFPILHMQLTNY